MDPLSILGAIAASSQIAQQSYDAIKFLNDIKTQMQNGPKKIRGQIQHIEQFITLLALVIKNTSLQTSEVSSVVKTCSNSAKDIKDSLESYLATPDEGKRVKWRKAFTAVRSEKKISSMIADLEGEKSLLSLHIQRIDLSLLQTVDLNANEIKLTVGAVANNVTEVKSILISMNSRSDIVAPTENINKSHFIVPNRRVSGFIGREDILNKIEEGLSSESESRIVVLRGLGGQGKTQIALEYCHRARKNHIRAIFWIDATSESTVKKDYKSVLEHIERPADSTQDDQVVTSVLNILREWDEPWLIIFDNHDDPSSFHLPDFMPSGQHGRILITSRHADTALLAERDHDIELHGLRKDDACDLLIKQSRVSNTASRDDAYAIVDRLGYHALAITQAGSYIQTQKIQLSQFMDNYNRQREAILRETPRMSQYRRKIGEAADETALNVFTTWELSYQQLETLDDEKKYKSRILTLFAFFDCQNISQQLFETYCTVELFSNTEVMEIDEPLLLFVGEDKNWDEQKFVDILNGLSRLSLIQSWYRDENDHCHLSLHPLVQDWIRVRASSELCYDSAVLSANVVATVLQQCYSHKTYTMPLSLRQELLSHLSLHEEIQELMVTLKKDKALSRDMLYLYYPELTRFYFKSGLYRESEKIARQWVVASLREYGPEDVGTLHAHASLANALSKLNNFEESFHIDQKVLKIRRKKYGSENPDVLRDTHNIAWSLMERGHLVRAEKIFRRLLEVTERILGHDDTETLSSIFALARVLQNAGEFAEAEVLCRNLVHDSQRILGPNHSITNNHLKELAFILEDQGKLSESLTCFESVYAHRLATLGPGNPKTLRSERDCAVVRENLELQLQNEQRKVRRGSPASQTSDSESDTESEVSELGDDTIFSTYERNLLWSSDSDIEQSLYSTSEGEEGEGEEEEEDEDEDADSILETKSKAIDNQIPEALKDGQEANEESMPEKQEEEGEKLKEDEHLED
ncbi:putative kinesin light chain protein [Botrytis fragariae]|uniref:Putative kinesin light chain protein n=1 Tax=Botrytis fragariae TaxID=1964551 RepID=A0A8H6ANE3_9HELO|nr:putative kinesin light chain protein [Botrytis fragariae]KAF5870455.1 putative kinesin light chain protein [Botrytis fragariae]